MNNLEDRIKILDQYESNGKCLMESLGAPEFMSKKASELVKQQTNARNDPSADVSDREDNYSDNNDNNDQADNDSNTTAMDLPLSLSFRSMSFDSEPKASQSSSGSQVSAATQLPVINHALELLNQSPIPSKKLNDNQFLNNKINRVSDSLKKFCFLLQMKNRLMTMVKIFAL
ncbi:uncharacterized protein LOC141531487 [Cotesia typhae]|uniref:uncharacterized protein LOC141531487 n=2 Tax=Cotesia typhae TaxID=2053667 RepID=UPI003D6884AF